MISLRLDDGVDPALVMGAVRRMPAAADAYASRTRAVSDSARRAVRFQVTALWLVSALALLAAGTVIVVIATRSLRLSDDERRSMTILGWRRSDLALDRGMEGGALAAVAVLVAAVVAAIVSSRFPLGVLRTFEPDPGLRVDWIATVIGGASLVITVVVTGLAVITVVVTVVVTSLAVGYGRRRSAAFRSPPTRSSSLVPSAPAGMPLSVGARFASSGPRRRRSWSQLVAGSLGVAGLLASVIVGLSLTRIVERPMR